MELKQLAANDFEKYDALVDESAEGTLFHKSWWFPIFENAPGINANRVEIYGVFNNGKLVAGFPVPYRKRFGVRWINNPLLTSYCGAIFKPDKNMKNSTDYSFRKEVYTNVIQVMRSFNACLYYPLNPNCMDLMPFLWSGYRPTLHYTYVLKLDDLDAVWENMTRKRRNDIKSSVRNGFKVRKDTIRSFTSLNDRSLERQGHVAFPDGIWERVYAECKKRNCVEIFTAYDGDDPLSSMLLVWDTKRSYYIGGGMNGNSRGSMPLLIWETIKYTKEELKLGEFDFSGFASPGIESFMRHFGGDLRPFFDIKDWKVDTFMSLRRAGKPVAARQPASAP